MASGGTVTVPIYGVSDYSISVDLITGVTKGSSAYVYISIGSQPSDTVTVSLTTSSSDISLSTTEIIFSNSDWS